MQLQKIIREFKYSKRRNYKLVTPCCGRSNKDGKFVNYQGLDDNYGYCHSCDTATLPPSIYLNERSEQFVWNNILNKYEAHNGSIVLDNSKINKVEYVAKISIKYIPDRVVMESTNVEPRNGLLQYISKEYGIQNTDEIINLYLVGTYKDYMIFWQIDKKYRVRKAKYNKFDIDGRRSNEFIVPYKNDQGYTACFFGEHLLKYAPEKTAMLVESEKTAIIASILLPSYNWLAYGGINGLTDNKIKVLKGHKILVIPDMSENAVTIANKRVNAMQELKINASVWDMTDGRSDKQLKLDGDYNKDLEDLFRKFKTNKDEN